MKSPPSRLHPTGGTSEQRDGSDMTAGLARLTRSRRNIAWALAIDTTAKVLPGREGGVAMGDIMPAHGALVVRGSREGNRQHGQILMTRLGLKVPENLAFDRWQQAGRQLSGIVESSAWCLGDWLVYGQRNYADRYQLAIEAANLDYQTLRNYAWVARRFEMSRRREGLSFQHHAEVASRPPAEQDELLDRAEKLGWSRNQLRRRVNERRQGQQRGGEAPVLPRLRVPPEQVERWRVAAASLGTGLDDWIVATLDNAAARVLTGNGPGRGNDQHAPISGVVVTDYESQVT